MHTPGPWTMDEVRTDSGRAFRIGSGEMLKAGKGCCIIYDDHGHRDNQRKANARLIAAAPEMYDFLRWLREGSADAALVALWGDKMVSVLDAILVKIDC
jgi:hypothetical protein